MKITDIEVLVLANPDLDPMACDSAQDAAVVLIHTDEGVTGIGEVDSTPQVVRAYLEAPSAHSFALGMRELLIGQDPRDSRRLWHKLYEATIMSGRRGMGIHALGAVDVALWDLRGKVEGRPIWQLLGGALRPTVMPYASILPVGTPGPETIEDAARRMRRVRELRFKAAKIEPVPEVTRHEQDVIDMVAASREALGPDVTLMVDVAYRWIDAKSAVHAIRELEQFDIYFVETPVHVDKLRASAELSRATDVRIAYGELNAGRQEFIELMDVGGVDVVQPDVPRAGGITESMRIAEAAEDRGRLVVPHAWNTGITTAAALQVAAATSNTPFIEYLPPALVGEGLRRDLLSREAELVDGELVLPEEPGLGIELDPDAVSHYRLEPEVRA